MCLNVAVVVTLCHEYMGIEGCLSSLLCRQLRIGPIEVQVQQTDPSGCSNSRTFTLSSIAPPCIGEDLIEEESQQSRHSGYSDAAFDPMQVAAAGDGSITGTVAPTAAWAPPPPSPLAMAGLRDAEVVVWMGDFNYRCVCVGGGH